MHHHRRLSASRLQRPRIEAHILGGIELLAGHSLLLQTRDVKSVERGRRLDRRNRARRFVTGEKRHLMRRAGRQIKRVESARKRFELVHRNGREAVVALRGQPLQHVVGHTHSSRRHRDNVRAESRERIDQRMNRAPKLQVTA